MSTTATPSSPRDDAALDPPPRIVAVHHLTLPVSDLEVAERFYVDILGLTLTQRFDRETFLRLLPDRAGEVDAANSPLHLGLRCGQVEIDLFLRRDHVPGPLRPHPHLALELQPDDLLRFRARLAHFDVPVDGPRRLGPPGHASLYFADPFGNLLELATMEYEGEVALGPPDLDALTRAARRS